MFDDAIYSQRHLQAYNVNEGYLNLDDRGLLFKVASIVLDQLDINFFPTLGVCR